MKRSIITAFNPLLSLWEAVLKSKLILNADDFGRSLSINRAVIRAHQEGILTSTSLMVNGDSFTNAVELAKQNPKLGVGLHITVAMGRSTLLSNVIPSLVDGDCNFSNSPVAAGMKYFFAPGIRAQLKREIAAQFDVFHQTNLKLDHVNGHLNFHLHPTILGILLELKDHWKGAGFRITRDDFALSEELSSGHWWYRFSHATIFSALGNRAAPALKRITDRTTTNVFGLLQNDEVDEQYLLNLLPRLPAGPVEIYSHPNMETHQNELNALLSSRVADTIKKLGIQLCRYQDL